MDEAPQTLLRRPDSPPASADRMRNCTASRRSRRAMPPPEAGAGVPPLPALAGCGQQLGRPRVGPVRRAALVASTSRDRAAWSGCDREPVAEGGRRGIAAGSRCRWQARLPHIAGPPRRTPSGGCGRPVCAGLALTESHVDVAVDLFQALAQLLYPVCRVLDPAGQVAHLLLEPIHPKLRLIDARRRRRPAPGRRPRGRPAAAAC